MTTAFPDLLRSWRHTRRFSQLDLALEANVSARHLSFLESGRARPSREMVLRLAEALDMPLDERNALLLGAQFAPAFSRHALDGPSLAPVREGLTRLMQRHEPNPAVLFDRLWNILDANSGARALFENDGATAVGRNLVDFMLDRDAVADRVSNRGDALATMALRLRAESRAAGGDPELDAMAARLEDDPEARAATPEEAPFPVIRLKLAAFELAFFSAIAELGSARDVTLCDLRLELFFPADDETRAVMASVEAAEEHASLHRPLAPSTSAG